MRIPPLFLIFLSGLDAQLMTKLAPETSRAFDQYVAGNEPKLIEQARVARPLPWLGEEARARAASGEVVIRSVSGKNGHPIANGLVHDWIGGMFIPGAKLDQVASVLQDFNRHKHWYPEIVASESIARKGGNVQGSWVLRKHKVITVVMKAVLDSQYVQVSPVHGYIESHSKPVIEVADYGTAKQSEYPAGEGHGFLWRLNGYWTLHQADGGVYAECRSISLSRDVPGGLGWIINPFIRSMPRESLESTLRNTREAVKKL